MRRLPNTFWAWISGYTEPVIIIINMFNWRLARPPKPIQMWSPSAISNSFLADRLFFKDVNPTSEQLSEWTASYINLLPIDIDTLGGTFKALYRPLSLNEARLHGQGYIANKDVLDICQLWRIGDTEPSGIFRDIITQKILIISGSEMAAISDEEQSDMYREMHLTAVSDAHEITNKYIQLIMFAFNYRYEEIYNKPLSWIYMMVEMAKNKMILTQNLTREEFDIFIIGNRPVTESEKNEIAKIYPPGTKEYMENTISWDQHIHRKRTQGNDNALDAAQIAASVDPNSLR